ncbi:MAG: hypothetical protein WCL71_02075 [Deltaproteobacteria bacterium]
MDNKRKRFFKALIKGTIKLLSVSGSVLGSMYDTGSGIVNRTCKTVLHSEQTDLEHSIYESKRKITSLRYEIGKESMRLKWYGMLKKIHAK